MFGRIKKGKSQLCVTGVDDVNYINAARAIDLMRPARLSCIIGSLEHAISSFFQISSHSAVR